MHQIDFFKGFFLLLKNMKKVGISFDSKVIIIKIIIF